MASNTTHLSHSVISVLLEYSIVISKKVTHFYVSKPPRLRRINKIN
jgi:hypothetical protein